MKKKLYPIDLSRFELYSDNLEADHECEYECGVDCDICSVCQEHSAFCSKCDESECCGAQRYEVE